MFSGKEDFKEQYLAEITETIAKPFDECSKRERYEALVNLICRRAARIHAETKKRHDRKGQKQIYYFSMEFLLGRLLNNYLIDFGLEDAARAGLSELGEDLDSLLSLEPDPGLGNGGLGRLAACFLDSMAFLDMSGTGMGARYRFGLFRQKITDGRQVEEPDPWMVDGYPWERRNPDKAVQVHFGGQIERTYENNKMSFNHTGYQTVLAVPYEVPIAGYGGKTVNMLRLWQAEPESEPIDLAAFNRGQYGEAVRERGEIEALTAILYPDDSTLSGKELRLKQEYFLTAAGIASIIGDYKHRWGTEDWRLLPERIAIHINDTHPTLCIPELLRILLDQEHLEWEEAWNIVTRTISFTNHTVLPEALEKWPIDLMQNLLPRIYMLIEEIDRRYCKTIDRTDSGRQCLAATAILWEGQVRMANLSIIGSYSVNGVAFIHTNILKNDVFNDFYRLMPQKFNNKTNGVSHRRFLLESNPGLGRLLTDVLGGDEWITSPGKLENLLAFRKDEQVLSSLGEIKLAAKNRLARYVEETSGIRIDPASIFDVQVKRIHAYKRQLLNILKILYLYNRLKKDPAMEMPSYTFLFSGKAAPNYVFAKEVIRLINAVADKINNDPEIKDRLKVVFLENFGVSLGQLIYPAADISEQISTAGKEASGTGNMKFMFNGAITLGTMDGANVEIRRLVGNDNIFIFGLSSEEIKSHRSRGDYRTEEICRQDPQLLGLVEQLVNDFFQNKQEPFLAIHDDLIRYNDEYFVLADFRDYLRTFKQASSAWMDPRSWQEKSLINIAKAGHFSSDRTIRQYARDIWHI